MDLHALQADSVLREYKIIRLLGEGGFGLTYLAFDTHLEKNVAIKEYLPSEHAVRNHNSHVSAKSGSAEKIYQWGLKAFINEAKTLAKFEHPNIVRVFRFFEENGTAYIVMEYCQSGSLAERIKKNQTMQQATLQAIIGPIVEGLSQVHEHGILHRDIKPDNIVFRKDETPVLIDFGAARQAMGGKSRKLTTIVSPGYAPLEQYTSDGSIGPWSDIYSLAAVSYLCLTGQKPPDIMDRLNEDNIKQLNQCDQPSVFLAAIDAGLALQSNDRPQTLSQWSSAWLKPTHAVNQPIYAQKDHSTDLDRVVSTPISVRKSFEQETKTMVNTIDLSHTKKNRPLRLLFLAVLLGLSLFFIDWKFNDKKTISQLVAQWYKITNSPTQPSADLVLKIQKALNKLGHKAEQSGLLDQQTVDLIEQFEHSNNWLITGQASEQLLAQLEHHYQKIQDHNWQKAIQENSQQALQGYIDQHPNGQHISKAQNLIESLKKSNDVTEQMIQQNNQDQQRLKEIAQVKKQLVRNIQNELIRLKFTTLNNDGTENDQTANAIKQFQKVTQNKITGLPTKTLLFQLKSQQKWPGRMSGDIIQSCQHCPKMVVIPAGQFNMGSDTALDNEKPQHHVNIKEFTMSTTEITFQQWDACYQQGGCQHKPDDEGTGRGEQAVMRVNWQDTQDYIKWLNATTDGAYRLPTESEWEYAARAGTNTDYHWGDAVGVNNANCSDCQVQANSPINQVKSFAANAFGLYDMHGNVWEWTQDCWHPNYIGAPSDNEAWEPFGCTNFVVRGGSGGNPAKDIRSTARGFMSVNKRLNSLGFRIVSD